MRAAVLAAMLLAPPAIAAPRSYDLPPDKAAFAPGPNLETVQGNCSACHSADYVATQPRHLPNERAFWQAEVTKMKGVYGAPIDPADIPKIVDYLVQTYSE